MRSLFSITIVTLRDVARSKLAITLSFFLAVLAIALPFALAGDGSAIGQARVTVLYTLTIAMIVLSFASVWMAAASISSDVRTKTLQLVRVKPVRMWKLWIGKWGAFLLLDGALLAGFLLLLCGRIALGNGGGFFQNASLKVPPVLPPLNEQAEITYQRTIEGQKFSKEERQLLKAQIKAQIPYATATLAKGESWDWKFDLPRAIRPGEKLLLRAHFDADARTREKIAAECSLHAPGGGQAVIFQIDDFSSREFLLPFDVTPLAGRSSIVLTIHHIGREDAGPVMLQPRQNLVILQETGHFFQNLLRSYLILLSILSVLIAVGLSFGALFTLPVAVFCSVGFILSVLVSRYIALDPDILVREIDDKPEPVVTTITRVTATISSRTLTFLSRPALEPSPINELSNGEWVPREELSKAMLYNFLLIPAFFAFLLSFPLSRKELPE